MKTQQLGIRVISAAVAGILVWGLGGGQALAQSGESKVLSGMSVYQLFPGTSSRPLSPDTRGITATEYPAGADRPLLGANPLPSVPEYVSGVYWSQTTYGTWGCSPTSGGMLVGWWDGQPGLGNLYKKGDPQLWWGDGTTGTRRMVLSQGHIEQTDGHGVCTQCPTAEDRSLSCFMCTDPNTGGTYYSNIAPGLEAFVEWDDTSAYDMKDYYPAEAAMNEVPHWNPDPNVPDPNYTFSYAHLKAEIDAGRPMLLDVVTAEDANTWPGHSVVAYGYADAMFEVAVPVIPDPVVMTVGGFAVMDTWTSGTSFSEWLNGEMNAWVTPVIDPNGVEWWPFIEFQGASWIGMDPGPYDWMINEGISLNVIPEPAMLVLLGLGSVAVLRKRRR